MSELNKETFPSCGKKAHDFKKEEALDCAPPLEILEFGGYSIDKSYRKALHKEYPFYTTEEVVGSFLGHNPYFPSQSEWLESKGNK